jgi:hypothetical protein
MNSEKEDIPVMLDCLQELFNEYGDAVTPTLLVERIERKLHTYAYCRPSIYFFGVCYQKIECKTKIQHHPESRTVSRKSQ